MEQSIRSPQLDGGSDVMDEGPDESNSSDYRPNALQPLSGQVQELFMELSNSAKKETWETKARFPPHLRTPLFTCAKIALATRAGGGYMIEDNFFMHLQEIFPYNRFTLKKLVYRNILPEWAREVETLRNGMITTFTTRVESDGAASGLCKTDNGQDVEGNRPRFMWTQGLRLLLWEIMEKFMELRAAAKELHAIDSTFPMHESEMLTRDNAYQKILACFPQGWMTVSEITRQYSLLKEKVSNQEQAARRRTESRELMEHQDTEQQQQQQQLSRTRRPLSVATSTPSTEFRRYSPVSATMSSPTTNDSYQPISPAMSPVRAMVQVPLREDGNREVKVPDNNVNNQHQTSEERRQSNDTATTRRYIESSHRMSQPPFSKSHTIEQHHRHQRQYQQQHQQQQYHQQHQPQQRQYLAPPQTSSRPTTTDSVPKYPQNDRQHLLRPPMSSLPPSPISPQTSWKTSEANPLKVAVTAAKRARDGNGVDALALRPMKPIPMPTSLPPSLPLPRPPPPPPQSVPGPSSSSSSATAPHHQSILASMRNHNPRPIPAPVHQAIYDSLLKAQGGPAKRIRVDYRRPGEKDDVEADSGIVAGADTYAAKGAAGKAPMENQYRHEEHSRQFQSQHQQQQYQQKPQQHHSHQHPYQHPRQQQQTMPYQSRDWHSDDKAPPGERRPLMQERVLDERSKGKRGLELEQRRRVERERMAYEMSLEADRSRKEREESERKRWQAEELDVKMQGKKEEIEGMRQLEEEERRVEFQMEMLQKEQQRLQFLKQMKRQQRPPSTEQCPQETTSTWKSHHRQGSEGTVKYEADRSPRPLTGAPHFQHRFPPQPSGEYRDHQWKTQQNAANPARVAEGQGRPAGHEEMQREHDPEASRRQEEPRLQQLSFQHRSDSHAHPQR